MDELSITPEELARLIGQDEGTSLPPLPASSSSRQLSQEEISRMIDERGSTKNSRTTSLPQITPDELAGLGDSMGMGGFGGKSSGGSRQMSPQLTPEELAQITAPTGMGGLPPVTARPAQFAPLQSPASVPSNTNLDLLLGVTLRVTVELGRTKMTIQEVLKLGPGSVVELDKLAGEPVDVLINERLVARGEVVVIDDRFGVRITDVIPPVQRIHSLH